MNVSYIIQGFWITYAGFWVALVVGFLFARFVPFVSKIGEKIYNYRVNLLKRWPYTLLRQAIIDHKVVTLFLVGRSVFMGLFGVVFVSPVLLFLGGFLTPCLLTLWKDNRALVWSMAIIVCESAGYAVAAGMGIAVGWSWIFEGMPLVETVIENGNTLLYGFLAGVGLQVAAAVLEAVAVIRLRIPSIPLDAILEE